MTVMTHVFLLYTEHLTVFLCENVIPFITWTVSSGSHLISWMTFSCSATDRLLKGVAFSSFSVNCQFELAPFMDGFRFDG